MPTIATLEDLEENLSTPTEGVVQMFAELKGDLLVLGAGGKMGPSLSRMAVRAIRAAGGNQRVLAVSRFSDQKLVSQLESWGVETVQGDLMDPTFVGSLPKFPHLIYMAGKKFGTGGAEALTWASNTYLPSLVCNHFRKTRIVAFSTGNVYQSMPVDGPGSMETDSPNPNGEYGMSCLGRERMFEYFCIRNRNPMALIRLNYATELRYGVLVDLAQKVFREEEVPLGVGYFNVIWQADANAMTLSALIDVQSPPLILNVTGPELLSCRQVAESFAALMNKKVRFTGSESTMAAHTCAKKSFDLYGMPQTRLEEMVEMTADWVMRNGATHGKPTHFEVADGKY